jgi:hypothetical protein
MKTIITTVRIRLDQAVRVEEVGMNISEFVRCKLDEEFGSKDLISEKEKELKDQLKKLKQARKESHEKKKNISPEEEEFLKEIKGLVKKNPSYIEGRWRRYKNDFGRMITLEEFKEAIEKWQN